MQGTLRYLCLNLTFLLVWALSGPRAEALPSSQPYLSADYLRIDGGGFKEKDLLISAGVRAPINAYLDIEPGVSVSAELLADSVLSLWLNRSTVPNSPQPTDSSYQGPVNNNIDNGNGHYRYSGVPLRLETLLALHRPRGSGITPELLGGATSALILHENCAATDWTAGSACHTTSYFEVGLGVGAGIDFPVDGSRNRAFVRYLHVFATGGMRTDLIRAGFYF